MSDFIEVNAGMEDGNTWESVHVCPNCEWVINLADIDLRTITTESYRALGVNGRAKSKSEL